VLTQKDIVRALGNGKTPKQKLGIAVEEKEKVQIEMQSEYCSCRNRKILLKLKNLSMRWMRRAMTPVWKPETQVAPPLTDAKAL